MNIKIHINNINNENFQIIPCSTIFFVIFLNRLVKIDSRKIVGNVSEIGLDEAG